MASVVQPMGLVALIFLFLNLLLTGCGAKAAPTAEPHAHGTFLQQLRQTDQPVPHPGVESVLAKRDGVAVPVEGFPAHPPFQTIARSNSMETYPCSQCHDKPLAGMLALRRKDQPNSHWQVKLQHAPDNIMSCQTCHGEGDMNQLVTLTGKQVSMDAPYQVCAQCHASQVNDWAGGAHGKRLGGWAPPRVVQTCTGCHNPHAPAFESRWPAVLGKGDANYPGR